MLIKKSIWLQLNLSIGPAWSGPTMVGAHSDKVGGACTQRSQGRIDKIQSKAKVSEHTIFIDYKKGTKVVVSVNCTCNKCGHTWLAKPSNYIKTVNGCIKCAH